jgi:hypothetical protein
MNATPIQSNAHFARRKGRHDALVENLLTELQRNGLVAEPHGIEAWSDADRAWVITESRQHPLLRNYQHAPDIIVKRPDDSAAAFLELKTHPPSRSNLAIHLASYAAARWWETSAPVLVVRNGDAWARLHELPIRVSPDMEQAAAHAYEIGRGSGKPFGLVSADAACWQPWPDLLPELQRLIAKRPRLGSHQQLEFDW